MNVYEIITERITDQLSKGVVPWQRPWSGDGVMPKNLVSKKEYRGVNTFMLNCAGYASPYFLTFKQCEELGGSVRKGSKGFPVVFWKWLDKEQKEEGNEKGERIPLLRYYTVFNIEQCDGIPADKIPPPPAKRDNAGTIEEAEAIIRSMPKRPIIEHKEERAYYRPSADYVNMPDKSLFVDDPHYYAVLFHELTHSTGHRSRLNRHDEKDYRMHYWGDENYAREELVAEMGSAFLMGHVGADMPDIKNSAAYIQSWMKEIKKDSRLIVMAAAQAQKAADYILNRKFEG